MAVSTVVGTRGLPSAPSSDPALPLTPLRLPGGVLSLWESPHVPARDSRRPLSSSREMCDQSHNITMCPLCDKTCSYWKMSSACATARASHLFDNPATVFFSVFMALWGERAEAPGAGGATFPSQEDHRQRGPGVHRQGRRGYNPICLRFPGSRLCCAAALTRLRAPVQGLGVLCS